MWPKKGRDRVTGGGDTRKILVESLFDERDFRIRVSDENPLFLIRCVSLLRKVKNLHF